MTTPPSPARQLAVCLRSDDSDLVTPRRIYEVLPDESAARSPDGDLGAAAMPIAVFVPEWGTTCPTPCLPGRR